MQKTFACKLLSVASLTIILSSCSVFNWVDRKTDEWGRSMPVSNEARRCANSFCSERDYQMQQGQQQQSPQATMPAVPVAPVAAENMMNQNMMGQNMMGQPQNIMQAPASQQMPMGMPMAGGAPINPSQMSQKDFMSGGGIAMPGMMPSPYQEAAQDPRLSAQEANPGWKNNLPPIPEGMSSMQNLEE